MPAVHDLTSGQLNALRSGGFAGEVRFAVCPNDVVFQAAVNQTITGASFISFAWDGTLQGAYGDVVAGMSFLITATSDPAELRAPLLRGRVSQAPSATVFYCNESAINLIDGYIVTVISNFEILQKDRSGALVDGYLAFQNLAPLVKNMQSFYYGESATEYSFSFAPVGQAMAQGASISSYAWTIAGATYTSGSSSTQNITVTVPYGHTWAYLDVTDSNAVSFRFIFEILVCDRNDPAYMYQAHDNITINGEIDSGWNISTTFFAGVENLLNRTRCAIVAFDVPKSGSIAASNVVFVGYIAQEETAVSGDAVSATLAQTRFELQSFAAIAGQLPVPSLPVRNVASPAAWGDINLPTSQRTIAYLLTRYSTLANLCSIDMLYTDSTWFAGEMDLEAGTLLDSVNRIGEEIQAKLVFFPQGDAAFEINANFLSDTDRDALPSLLASGNIEEQDVYGYSLPVPYFKTVGQVEAGCASFQTSGADAIKLDAIAPATARQEGNERPTILAQLLQANLSQANAITAAKQRIGDLLEYLNPPTTLPVTFKDGWRFLTPSTRVWLNFDLPAADSTRGLAITSTQRWLLQSVALTWNIDSGSWDVSGTARLETQGGVAQTAATISPNVIDTSVPVLPLLSDYDAFAPDGTLNYLSTDPTTAQQQPYRSPYGLWQFTPMTTEGAANAADQAPGASCTLLSPPLNFKSSATRTTPHATVNGDTYTVTVKGSAQIRSGWSQSINLVNSDGGFTAWIDGLGNPRAAWTMGTGWGRGGTTTPDQAGAVQIVYSFGAPTTITSVIIYGSIAPADGYQFRMPDSTGSTFASGLQGAGLTSKNIAVNATANGIWVSIDNGIGVDYLGAMTQIILYGTGTNPFTGDPAGTIYGDAFYQWTSDSTAELYASNRGLRLNSSPIAVPPEYNESHEYTFVYTGDGNATPFSYQLEDYSQAQNKILYLKVCGTNMGT